MILNDYATYIECVCDTLLLGGLLALRGLCCGIRDLASDIFKELGLVLHDRIYRVDVLTHVSCHYSVKLNLEIAELAARLL
jgi:hypothetical protein